MSRTGECDSEKHLINTNKMPGISKTMRSSTKQGNTRVPLNQKVR